MTNYYLLAIPIIIGISTGIFLTFNFNSESESNILTSKNLIDGGSPILGNPDASITILEWGDYQCTYCYKFHQNTLESIEDNFIKTGKVKLVFKDFTLNGPDSILAAEASYCAHDQKKYWEYHNEIYKNWKGERTGWVTRESLSKFANTVELDLEKFNKCLDSEKYQNKVLSLYEFGKEINIDATPSFLVFNDEKIIKIRGNQPLEVFLKTFDEL
ncbi:thioredoxin domain-containing protein [Nitrosopumilus sp.]|uniref:DsbA family protein n=1 Tax=Nitrosopumilus sp. TaxID=2024843 RepID=UPI00247EA8E9|nr:thioredoxin domain-containing protein [Nitrosopumilus sp.]MCV0430123.1 DsbA family protein [Nitrosopumilus sp.]